MLNPYCRNNRRLSEEIGYTVADALSRHVQRMGSASYELLASEIEQCMFSGVMDEKSFETMMLCIMDSEDTAENIMATLREEFTDAIQGMMEAWLEKEHHHEQPALFVANLSFPVTLREGIRKGVLLPPPRVYCDNIDAHFDALYRLYNESLKGVKRKVTVEYRDGSDADYLLMRLCRYLHGRHSKRLRYTPAANKFRKHVINVITCDIPAPFQRACQDILSHIAAFVPL